jgi:hypothetical protein
MKISNLKVGRRSSEPEGWTGNNSGERKKIWYLQGIELQLIFLYYCL